MHADARYCAALAATASSMRHSLSRFSEAALAPTFEDTNQGGGCTSRALTVVGQKAGTGLWTVV